MRETEFNYLEKDHGNEKVGSCYGGNNRQLLHRDFTAATVSLLKLSPRLKTYLSLLVKRKSKFLYGINKMQKMTTSDHKNN